jgi:Holliday junction resolvase
VTPEAKVKKAVRQTLDALGVYHFSPAANGYGRMGIPDIIGCYRGRFFAVECKAGRGKPTELQLLELEHIREAGGIALVVNEANLHDVRKALEELNETL